LFWLTAPAWHSIRVLAPSGLLQLPFFTLAGGNDADGNQDGPEADARFHLPHGITVSATGDVVVADRLDNALRLVSKARSRQDPRLDVSTTVHRPGRDEIYHLIQDWVHMCRAPGKASLWALLGRPLDTFKSPCVNRWFQESYLLLGLLPPQDEKWVGHSHRSGGATGALSIDASFSLGQFVWSRMSMHLAAICPLGPQGGHQPLPETVSMVGGRPAIVRFADTFSALAFRDPHLDRFIRDRSDPQGDSFADFITEKFGDGTP
jgi:hypothetical protein